jgi:glycosyltransferase involved in cell wall biosynthesis
MRILHAVEFYHPSIGGAQAVVRQISERLAAKGHDVTVATSHVAGRNEERPGGVRVVSFPVSGNAVRGMRGDVGAYQQYVRQGGFDVVLVYAAQQWTCDALLPVLHEINAKKVIVPCGFSGLHRPEYAGYFRSMPEYLRRFDAVVFPSNRYRDAAFARECGISHGALIPNGAAADEFDSTVPRFRDTFGVTTQTMILTVGSHTGLKGHRPALDGFRRAKIEDATLVLIGDRPRGGCGRGCTLRSWMLNHTPGSRSRGKRVRLLTVDRRDTIAAYLDADVFLFPSQLECSPLVLFEAMAAGCAFAATPAGNAAEIVEWSGGGILIPGTQEPDGLTSATAGDVAAAIERLVHDPALRRRLGRDGRAAWRSRFTFERIADEYEALYDKLLRGEPVTGAAEPCPAPR